MSGRSASSGFSLVEVIVAFAIATASLGVLFEIHSKATATVGRAREYLYAVELARSLVAEHATAAAVSSASGTAEDKYHWSVSVAPYDDPSNARHEEAAEPLLPLAEIRVTVSWSSRGKARDFELHTLRPRQSEPDDEPSA